VSSLRAATPSVGTTSWPMPIATAPVAISRG
jgi:hypothetical protein